VTSDQAHVGDLPTDKVRGARSPQRRWLILSLLLVALVTIVLVVAIGELVLSNKVVNPNLSPLGSSLAFGRTSDSLGTDSKLIACATVPCSFHNFSVTTAATQLRIGYATFSITTSTGTQVFVRGGFAILAPGGNLVGTYNFSRNNWTPSSASTMSLLTGDALLVYSTGPSPQNLAGDRLVASGSGPYTGTVWAAIS
jgi:hypothetical protein